MAAVELFMTTRFAADFWLKLSLVEWWKPAKVLPLAEDCRQRDTGAIDFHLRPLLQSEGI